MLSKQLIQIPLASDVVLEGMLTLGSETSSAVIFAHGSGSSRHSERNRFVAQVLQQAGIGTLLFDLLTSREDAYFDNRFNIDLLTDRLIAVTRWLLAKQQPNNLQLGYFGASTGTAAALRAAAELGPVIRAVVSRGGRPDLAEQELFRLRSPVLLLVGGNDKAVIDLNRRAFKSITAEKELVIIPGATHLFEEPGALNEVARLASGWFTGHFQAAARLSRRAS